MKIVLPETVRVCWACNGWGRLRYYEDCDVCGGRQFIWIGQRAFCPREQRGVGKSVVEQIKNMNGMVDAWDYGHRITRPGHEFSLWSRDGEFPPWHEALDDWPAARGAA